MKTPWVPLSVLALVWLSCHRTPNELVGPAATPWAPSAIVHNHSTSAPQSGGLFVLDTTGADHLVLNNYASVLHPSWSPDGRKIVFQATQSGTSEIYVVNTDGSGVRNLSNDPDFDEHPVWSPDGRTILFESWRGTVDLWVVDSSGTGLHDLTPFGGGDFSGVFSPDGRKVAYIGSRTGDKELYVTDLAGASHQNLTNSPSVNEYYPSWSPDGQHIIYVANQQIWIIGPDGAGRHQLTFLQDSVQNSQVAFSPQGERILFETASGAVSYVNADGSGQVTLTKDDPTLYKSAHWSPCGEYVAFNSRRNGSSQIYLVKAGDLSVCQLTDGPDDNGMPAWAPLGVR
jgi:Tol biopolymer transport system component